MSTKAVRTSLETILRHERLLLMAGVATVCGLAWLWLLAGAGAGMSAIDMTRMAGMDGWLMQPAHWSLGSHKAASHHS